MQSVENKVGIPIKSAFGIVAIFRHRFTEREDKIRPYKAGILCRVSAFASMHVDVLSTRIPDHLGLHEARDALLRRSSCTPPLGLTPDAIMSARLLLSAVLCSMHGRFYTSTRACKVSCPSWHST